MSIPTRMARRHIAITAFGALLLGLPFLAAATEPATPGTVTAKASAPALPAALDDTELGSARGGEAIVVGNQTLKSSLSGNSIAGNYTAGAVSFTDNAFSNFNGMGNVVINTGAQANLQSAMNLTINLGN